MPLRDPFPPPTPRATALAMLVAAAATAAITWWLGAAHGWLPLTHDEQAYVLQARLLAAGRLVGPAPPLPDFFQQFHVLVTPVLAPKYPLGHGLVLVPGVWAGWLPLMPLVLAAVAAALLTWLVTVTTRSLAAAGLAVLLWLQAPAVQWNAPGYFSEATSTAAWLGALAAAWAWDRQGRIRWALLAGALLGLCAITRPFVALGAGLPLAGWALREAARRGRLAHAAFALAAAVPALGLVGLQHRAATGSWFALPATAYARTYFPHDVPGFGARDGASTRPLLPDHRRYDDEYRAIHAAHTVGRLPTTIAERARFLLRDAYGEGRARWALLAFAGLGTLLGPPAFRLALLAAAGQFVAYLGFGHRPDWTLYQLEQMPLAAALAAAGIGIVLGQAGAWRLGGAAVASLLAFTLWDATRTRGEMGHQMAARQRAFERAVASVPAPAIVFVRYAPWHNFNRALVENAPDWRTAPRWLVHDLGTRNAELLARFPERRAFRYDEATRRIAPLPG
ncbi:MAG: hypothetical protein NW201_04625 [Gemmatimonadales bacterium]|nr:hypothetical protein [Gemmatimonadales bacterium]